MLTALPFLVITSLWRQAAAHAYVYWPTSREALDFSKVGSPYSFADKKVAAYLGDRYAGKLNSKHGAGKGGAPWARKKTADDWSKAGDGCNGLAMGTPVTTYKEGQEIEVVVPVHAEHGGEYEFRLCAKKWDSMSSDKEKLACLDEHLVYRACVNGKLPYSSCSCESDGCKRWGHTDPNDAIYTKYKGIGLYKSQVACTEGGYLLKMKLPPGVTCEHCTLQWYWFTFHNEEFWGCSDIKIEGAATPSPRPPPGGDQRRRSSPSPPSSRRRSPSPPSSRRRSSSPPASRRRTTRRRSSSRRRKSASRRRSTSPKTRRRSSRRRKSRRRSSSNVASSKGLMEDVIYRRLGCVPDEDAPSPSEAVFRDTKCLNTTGYSENNPCQGGLPFFRQPVKASTGVGDCYRFCTSMGLDLFGLAKRGTDCRCGASAENSAIWGNHSSEAAKRGLQLDYSKMTSEESEAWHLACKYGIVVYQYSAWLETNALGTVELLKSVSLENKAHIENIVRGAAAMPPKRSPKGPPKGPPMDGGPPSMWD